MSLMFAHLVNKRFSLSMPKLQREYLKCLYLFIKLFLRSNNLVIALNIIAASCCDSISIYFSRLSLLLCICQRFNFLYDWHSMLYILPTFSPILFWTIVFHYDFLVKLLCLYFYLRLLCLYFRLYYIFQSF